MCPELESQHDGTTVHNDCYGGTCDVRYEEISAIGVLGGGVMGGGIAQTAATFGYRVTVVEVSEELCERSRNVIVEGRFGLRRGLERGKLSQEQYDAAIGNLAFTTSRGKLSDVDLLIEAIPENLELKQRVFGELDRVVNPRAIFASNTSGYVIADLARDASPSRKPLFIGMHWFSPAPVMKAVEIVVMPETSPETEDAITRLTTRFEHVPIRVKDAPGRYGFIANRIWEQAYNEAQRIYEEGLATKADIDAAMRYGYGWPAGLFESIEGVTSGWQ